MKCDINVPWTALLYEGITTKGEFTRGQLFRFYNHYYICKNIPYSFDDCKEMELTPPSVGIWNEVIPETVSKCNWVYTDEDEMCVL